MRRFILMAIMLSAALLCGQNWQTLNNTNHVYSMVKDGSDLYLSTWGGVLHVEGTLPSQMKEVKHWTTGDGLVSNDIRSLSWIDFSSSLWFGSGDDGISIVSPSGIQNLDISLGLPSLRINETLGHGSRILVATAQGLAMFYYLPGVSFPLMLNQYNTTTTGGALLHNNITDIQLTDSGLLFLATDAGINYVQFDSLDVNSAWHSIPSGASLPASSRYLISTNAEKIAVATDTQVYLNDLDLNPDSWENTNLHPGIEDIPIAALKLTSGGDLWVSYGAWDATLLTYHNDSGLLLSRIAPTGDITSFNEDSQGLGLSEIASIHEFDEAIYICTWGDGIAVLLGQ